MKMSPCWTHLYWWRHLILLELLSSSSSSSSGAIMMRKDVNKPKGKTSAYAFFVQTCREEHRKKNPEQSVNFAEFSKKCSERWKVRDARDGQGDRQGDGMRERDSWTGRGMVGGTYSFSRSTETQCSSLWHSLDFRMSREHSGHSWRTRQSAVWWTETEVVLHLCVQCEDSLVKTFINC